MCVLQSALESQVFEEKDKSQRLQTELDVSEQVQRDFVKLSQTLQVRSLCLSYRRATKLAPDSMLFSCTGPVGTDPAGGLIRAHPGHPQRHQHYRHQPASWDMMSLPSYDSSARIKTQAHIRTPTSHLWPNFITVPVPMRPLSTWGGLKWAGGRNNDNNNNNLKSKMGKKRDVLEITTDICYCYWNIVKRVNTRSKKKLWRWVLARFVSCCSSPLWILQGTACLLKKKMCLRNERNRVYDNHLLWLFHLSTKVLTPALFTLLSLVPLPFHLPR